MLNFFEKFLISLIQAAPAVLPLFVHSQHGIAIVNASEAVLGAALSKASTPSSPETAAGVTTAAPVGLPPLT